MQFLKLVKYDTSVNKVWSETCLLVEYDLFATKQAKCYRNAKSRFYVIL